MTTKTDTQPSAPIEANKADGGDCVSRLVVPLLAWPDRCGFWIAEHHWGMELVESFIHGDDEEDESPYAIRVHHGGDTLNDDPFMPRDLESDIAAKPPRFLFVSDGNPFILHNVEAWHRLLGAPHRLWVKGCSYVNHSNSERVGGCPVLPCSPWFSSTGLMGIRTPNRPSSFRSITNIATKTGKSQIRCSDPNIGTKVSGAKI